MSPLRSDLAAGVINLGPRIRGRVVSPGAEERHVIAHLLVVMSFRGSCFKSDMQTASVTPDTGRTGAYSWRIGRGVQSSLSVLSGLCFYVFYFYIYLKALMYPYFCLDFTPRTLLLLFSVVPGLYIQHFNFCNTSNFLL